MQLVQHLDQEWVFRDADTPFEAVEKADLAVDLWHSGELLRAEEKFLSAIEKYPSHIDAIHHYSLFLESTGRVVEAYLACRAAVSVGLHVIPKEFGRITECDGTIAGYWKMTANTYESSRGQ